MKAALKAVLTSVKPVVVIYKLLDRRECNRCLNAVAAKTSTSAAA